MIHYLADKHSEGPFPVVLQLGSGISFFITCYLSADGSAGPYSSGRDRDLNIDRPTQRVGRLGPVCWACTNLGTLHRMWILVECPGEGSWNSWCCGCNNVL